jgi:hypothetical protein
MCFTQVGSGLTCKHYTRLERFARDTRSSLLRKSANYGQKKIYNIDTCPVSFKQLFSLSLLLRQNKLEFLSKEDYSTNDRLVLTSLDQLIFYIEDIIYLFTKRETLTRRSTVLSLSLQ